MEFQKMVFFVHLTWACLWSMAISPPTATYGFVPTMAWSAGMHCLNFELAPAKSYSSSSMVRLTWAPAAVGQFEPLNTSAGPPCSSHLDSHLRKGTHLENIAMHLISCPHSSPCLIWVQLLELT
ncbi:hypothetical protein AAC387_Pa06g3231 [Persea americana]